ncbi:MAG: CstA-like transporter-associated (seleno)protein [bacterium]
MVADDDVTLPRAAQPARQRRFARWMRAFRQVVGAPDYDAYLDHCRAAGHPPRVTKREFVRDFFERKGRAPRCC